MNIGKHKVKKYADFLKESLDPNKIKIGINSFNNKIGENSYTIHGELKDLSLNLYEEFNKNLKELPYHKAINFGGLKFNLFIQKSAAYHSFVDWEKFLKGDYKIVIGVSDNYDINYLISIIVHEFRHIIDFTDENLNNGLSSFDMEFNLRKYNIDKFRDFFLLVYVSLEHELVARNNKIYPYIKFNNLTKEQSLEILKTSFIWKSLLELKNFDVDDFIKRFEIGDLIYITNEFIKDVLYDNETKLDSYDDVKKFYESFNEYFIEISDKWMSLLLTETDLVYERKVYNYNDAIINGYKFILKDIWKRVKNKAI